MGRSSRRKLKSIPKIFESPDGGATVFQRDFLDANTRTQIESELSEGQRDMKDLELWNEIRQAAKTNNVLKVAKEEIITLYYMTKQYKER